jgi:hypothetical protein
MTETMIMPNFERKSGKRAMVKPGKFNPDRETVTDAVQDFLKKGGKIKKVVVMPDMDDGGGRGDVDEFLRGE